MQIANARLKEAGELQELRTKLDAMRARLLEAARREQSLRRALRRRHKQLGYAREERTYGYWLHHVWLLAPPRMATGSTTYGYWLHPI